MSDLIQQIFSVGSDYTVKTGIVQENKGDGVYEVNINGGLYNITTATNIPLEKTDQVLVVRTEVGMFILSKTYKNKTTSTDVIIISG